MRHAKRNVWVFANNKWEKGHLLDQQVMSGVRARVQVRDSQMITNQWPPQKYNGKRFQGGRTEMIPKASIRLPRFRAPCIQVIPVCFQRVNEYGDFAWMIKQPQYSNCLFVYNENLSQWADELDLRPGGGNAVIRPYRDTQAIGIPTGHQEGFTYLDAHVCRVIQKAMQGVANRIVDKGYTTIFYSCCHLDDLASHCPHLSKATIDICGKHALVGKGIFDVCIEVRAYITRMLLATKGRVREQFRKRRDSVRYRVA